MKSVFTVQWFSNREWERLASPITDTSALRKTKQINAHRVGIVRIHQTVNGHHHWLGQTSNEYANRHTTSWWDSDFQMSYVQEQSTTSHFGSLSLSRWVALYGDVRKLRNRKHNEISRWVEINVDGITVMQMRKIQVGRATMLAMQINRGSTKWAIWKGSR